METACEYLDDKVMWVSSDQQKIINRIRKLAEAYPDDVTIKRHPETNDGCIYATMPAEWLKLSPPLKREMSDEQKAELAERLKKARAKQNDNSVSSGRTENTL